MINEFELHKQKMRFYRLANGLLAIAYIAFFTWVASSLFNMIF